MNRPDAPDVRKVAETALDVFVYAPVGLAFEARSLLPKLAERGRNQVVLARFGARFFRQRAEAEAERLLGQVQAVLDPPITFDDPVDDVPVGFGDRVTEPTPAPAPKSKRAKPTRAKADKALPISGYDTMAASHVVPRLAALKPAELEAIRIHEATNRGRRTILNRIAQLQK